MQTLTVKPTDKFLKDYYTVLGQMGQLHIDHEMAVRSAFQNVLTGYSRRLDWTLVPEYPVPGHKNLRIDAALLDFWKQRRGFWEAKDEHDDLEREIKSKLEKGYPRTNTIFQAPERAVLFQNGIRQGLDEDIRDPKKLAELLTHFFAWREADHEEWEAAVAEFKQQIPELAEKAKQLIEGEKKSNRAFRDRFEDFYKLCRDAINPNLNELAVENMLIQHLLTERINGIQSSEPSAPSALKDVQVFNAFASAGSKLAELHVNYEHQPEFPLTHIENPNEKLTYRVEKMRLGKDKASLFYNSFLTLTGIPPETYEYRLGNRSALEWIIDQYQVSTDKRSGITNDPNRENDPEYILKLIGQVIYVSLETMKIVKSLPRLGVSANEKAATGASQ